MQFTTQQTFYCSLKLALAILFLIAAPAQAEPAPHWTQAARFGGSGTDIGAAIRISRHGDRYVTGSFSTVATFGGKTLTSAGGSDIFLAKYARGGQLLWLVQAGGSGDDAANDLSLDEVGNIYVTGWFVGPASFGSVSGPSRIVSGSDETVFIAKYSPAGTLLWLNTGTVGFFAINRGHGVAVDGAANTLYVTGVSQGDTAFSSSDGETHTVPGPGTWHMFLVKYDLSGNFHWGEWNEASPNSIPRSLAVDSENSAYVAGWFEGVAIFHSQDGHDQTISGRSQPVQSAPDFPGDAFIAKYDSDGNLRWVNDIGGYKAIATSVAASRDGRIALTGFIGNINTGTPAQAKTILTSQPGGSSINLGGGHFTTPYNRDVFIAIYSRAGVLMGATRLGGVRQDGGSGIAFDPIGNLYAAGVFGDTLHVGDQILTGTKTSNLFVLKYTGGRLAWAKSADGAGTQSFEGNPTLSLARSGRVWLTGPFTNTATFDGTTLHSAGAEDIFAAELK
jgi:beta-propeller repeat-containing protein